MEDPQVTRTAADRATSLLGFGALLKAVATKRRPASSRQKKATTVFRLLYRHQQKFGRMKDAQRRQVAAAELRHVRDMLRRERRARHRSSTRARPRRRKHGVAA